ncbi:replication initiator protein [Microviridae sp.]|nr:replication initiator protein [Microviridae sp.]
MPCYNPLEGWRSRDGSGKLVFNRNKGFQDLPVTVSCGQCIGCRLERSRQWALRCYHESTLHAENCFVTLTYDNENLPSDGSLNKKHFQDFMKRLRASTPLKIRYFHCGEYGEVNRRPHYHACLFGYDFPDKQLFKKSGDYYLYTSPLLSKLWPQGFSTIGELTFDTAAYTARYVLKKVTGKNADDHYTVVDPETGEIHELQPEYTTMSLKPGIGQGWFEKFNSEVYPSDSVVINGKECNPPRYYDKLLAESRPYTADYVRSDRKANGRKHLDNNTPERLAVRKQVATAKTKTFKRDL